MKLFRVMFYTRAFFPDGIRVIELYAKDKFTAESKALSMNRGGTIVLTKEL